MYIVGKLEIYKINIHNLSIFVTFIYVVIVASPRSTHAGERAKTSCLEIRIMCLSGATFLLTAFVLVNYHYKNPTISV